jgi:peptidoglycan/LPS O-acetylase OafA/YrhL
LSKQDNFYFPALTGLRAIAAFMVYLFHFNPFENHIFFWKYVNEFHIGVDIFFVLSGFLISIRYKNDIQFSVHFLYSYFIKRFARIYPVFFILTIITYLSQIISDLPNESHTFIEIVKHYGSFLFLNLTFLNTFFYDLRFIGIPQGWTLTIEEMFYISAPFLLSIKRVWLLFSTSILILILGFVLVYFFSNTLPFGFMKDERFMLTFTFFGKVFEFCLGIYLAQIFFYQNNSNSSRHTKLSLASILTLIYFLVQIKKYDVLINLNIDRALINFGLPFLIILLIKGLITENSIISRILSSKLFQLLGKSSYVFYLIHMGILQVLLAKYVVGNQFIQFIILVLLSIVIYLLIEKPLNQKIRNKFL